MFHRQMLSAVMLYRISVINIMCVRKRKKNPRISLNRKARFTHTHTQVKIHHGGFAGIFFFLEKIIKGIKTPFVTGDLFARNRRYRAYFN